MVIVVVASAILTGLFVLAPIVTAESSSTLATLAAIAIPTADVVLLAVLTQLVFRGRMPNFALTCISVAIVSTLLADPIYSYLSLKGTYDIGMPVDAGWLIQEDEDELKEEHRGHLAVVQRNAHRLLGLVSDLLFAAQVQAGRVTLEKDLVSVSELLDEAVAAALPTAADRQIDVTVHASDAAHVIGDRQRLAQVLDNLLSNALKFTPPNGSVVVSMFARDTTVLIDVSDTGLGISPADQKKLFTRFFRTEAAVQKAIKGTGLGLSIVKAIVEGHGEITVESAEGKGATFRVVLPLAAAVGSLPVKEAA